MTNRMTVYKVVKINEKGEFVSSLVKGTMAKRYEIGVELVDEAFPMFAFATLKDAFSFVRQHGSLQRVILECDARKAEIDLPRRIPTYPENQEETWVARGYWHALIGGGAIEFDLPMSPPTGTVLCTHITPLKIMKER